MKLAPDEEHPRYLWRVVPPAGQHAAAVHVAVEHVSTGYTVCSMQLYSVGGADKLSFCDDLHIGHLYTVRWTGWSEGAELQLYGAPG